MRKAEVARKTSETDIRILLDIDSPVKSDIHSGVPFLDHMLDSMSRHGRFHVGITCAGDLKVDDHHSVEDVGIALGEAFRKAAGDKAGITRFGESVVPMDDALVLAACDISGRGYFKYTGSPLNGCIGTYNCELTVEFFRSFAVNFGINLHIRLLDGDNRHHIHEAIFKSVGISMGRALAPDPSALGKVPSTKGSLQ